MDNNNGTQAKDRSMNHSTSPALSAATTYTPGIGWQYALMQGQVLVGRFGSFEWEHVARIEGEKEAARRNATPIQA